MKFTPMVISTFLCILAAFILTTARGRVDTFAVLDDSGPYLHLTAESVNYRKIAKLKIQKGCNICEVTNEYLLAVHHRDHDRSNNTISNFEVLCFNHHVLRHLTNRNGRIIYNPKGLTPEDVRIKIGMPAR